MTERRPDTALYWRPCRPRRGGAADRIAAIGWGTFFVWLGIALLADVGWGVGLLGIGLIALGAQAARWLMRLRLEVFWLLFGAGFLIAGSSRLVGSPLPVIPLFLVLGGVAVVFAALPAVRRRDRS